MKYFQEIHELERSVWDQWNNSAILIIIYKLNRESLKEAAQFNLEPVTNIFNGFERPFVMSENTSLLLYKNGCSDVMVNDRPIF